MKSLNDFNSHPRLLGLTLSRFTSKEETREPRTNRVCSTHQLSSIQRIQSLCGPLRRQQARATVLMLGPIPDHGFCPINLPREFARHRSVSASPRSQALSLWLSWSRQAFYVGRCQRDSRLENLCRFRPESDSDRAALVRRHRLGSGTRINCLRARRDHHRSMSVALSLGQVPPTQGRYQTAHAARDSQHNPSIYRHYRGVAARRQRSRSHAAAARFIHRHGSRLRRFRAPLSIASGPNFLCHSSQRQPEFPPPLFTSGRSPRWHSQRSNHRASRTKEFVALSHGAAPSQLPFARNRSATGALDQQLLDPSAECRGSLSLLLADRTLLQMDQTTSAHQAVFRYFNQQRQDSNLERRFGLCAGSDRQETARPGAQSLHNSTDLESHTVRENAPFTGL